MVIVPGRTYQVKVTLLDCGHLWDHLSTLFLEKGACKVRLGEALLLLTRLVSTPTSGVLVTSEPKCTVRTTSVHKSGTRVIQAEPLVHTTVVDDMLNVPNAWITFRGDPIAYRSFRSECSHHAVSNRVLMHN